MPPTRAWVRWLYGLGGLLAFLLVWRLAGALGWVPPGTLPDPADVPAAVLNEWRSNRLLPAVGSSLIHYVWGLAAGTSLGFLAALLAGSSQRADWSQAWLVRVLRPIPPLAWVVFAIAWFKVSHAGAAFVIAIGVFWVNYFATYSAVRNVDPKWYELASTFGHGSFLARTTSITLPAIAPGALSGARAGIGQAWMTLIAAELLGVPGMGQEMNAAAGVGAYDVVIVYMLAVSVLYSLTDLVFVRIERALLSWRPA